MPGPDSEAGRRRGQWSHADLFEASVPAESQLSLGEGWTPLQPAQALGRDLGIPGLWLKREDLSPTGSHKARSLGLMVSDLKARGIPQAVISSSGNAAVAAAAYCSLAGIRLLSLVSPRTPAVKLAALLNQPQLVVVSEHPVALLRHAVTAWGMADLRTSTNPLGAAAYRGIAAELVSEGAWQAVFVFANSGATALGIQEGFARLLSASQRPQVHLVEASPGGELTRPWYGRQDPLPASGVGDLGTRRSRLAPRLRRAVREGGGRGWRVDLAGMEEVRELTDRHAVATSWEGLAALAAARALAGQLDRGRWAVVLSGAAEQLDLRPADPIPLPAATATTSVELDRILAHAGFVAVKTP
ncbi:MAG: PLP-dependent lyase/thiolase [Candidatus Dormibacteria bacterium]